MCDRSVRGLLDRRLGSAVDDGCRAWGSQGPPWSLSISSWKMTCRAAGGGVRLRRRDSPGFLVSWRCSGVPPCTPEAWGLPGAPPRGERSQGAAVYARGATPPGWWTPQAFWRAACLRGSERPGTAAAGGLRCVLGSTVIQGFPRYHGPAWPHRCAGRRAGATASGVHSFHPGCRPPYAP